MQMTSMTTEPKRNPNKCVVCNSWKKKHICINCHWREKEKEEARMLEVNGQLPAKARIGKI